MRLGESADPPKVLDAVAECPHGSRDFQAWHKRRLGKTWLLPELAPSQVDVDQTDRAVRHRDRYLNWPRRGLGR